MIENLNYLFVVLCLMLIFILTIGYFYYNKLMVNTSYKYLFISSLLAFIMCFFPFIYRLLEINKVANIGIYGSIFYGVYLICLAFPIYHYCLFLLDFLNVSKEKIQYFLMIPFFFNLIYVVINFFVPFIYKLENGSFVFINQILIYIPYLVILISVISTTFYILKKLKFSVGWDCVMLIGFQLIPLIALVLIISFRLYNYLWTFYILSMLFTFIFCIIRQSHIDGLTGLYNRNELNEHLIRYKVKSKKCNILAIMIDINDFKSINDRYGHVVGDEALIEASNILKMSIKDYKMLLVRYAGDEFLIMKTYNKEEEIENITSLINGECQKFNKKNKTYQINFSFGTEIFNKQNEFDGERFVEQLDKKMYEDKRNK